MPGIVLSPPYHGDVWDTWRSWAVVTDNDGISTSADSITVAVTLPDGSSATGTATAQAAIGLYLLTYEFTAAGSHTFVITIASTEYGDDVQTFIVHVRATSGSLPDLAEVIAYLGDDTSSTAQEIQDALDSETAAQARRCTIPAEYPEDLAQALKRRVARNLAARSVPVASFTSFEGGGTVKRVPMLDAEIMRLEAPFRRLVVR